MKISLIVGTIGRTDELKRLFASLETQTHQNFEVIVVDQNPDGRLQPILTEFSTRLPLRHITTAGVPGLSRARNIGIRGMAGEVVCFPDDDCWYPKEFLQQVNDFLTAHPEWDAVVGDVVDELGRPILPWRDRSGIVTKPMCWRRAISVACVFRAGVLGKIGGFDETLGVGAGTPWGSGEDNDLMLRAIENGFRVQYETDLRVHHPQMFRSFDAKSRARRLSYSLADGRMLRKHPMPLWWRVLFFGVPLGRMFFSVVKLAGEESRFHWITFVGRAKGFRLGT